MLKVQIRINLNSKDNWFRYERYGLIHRVGGPAGLCIDQYQIWCEYGKLHRGDGPAIISPHGYDEYHVRGIRQC
jgi:hypothetical protein